MPSSSFVQIPAASFWTPRHLLTSAWLEHAPFAFSLVQMLKPQSIVELGTHHGFSFLAFCQAVETCGLGTRCYAIDTWMGDDQAGFYGEDVFNKLQAIVTEAYPGFASLLRNSFNDAAPYFAEGDVDLLHIDGAHRYEDVAQDFNLWLPKLSKRGVILFHDTNVRHSDFGVWKLWKEIAPQYPSFEFIHGHGLGVLGVGPDLPDEVKALLACTPEAAVYLQTAYAQLGAAVTMRSLKEAMQSEAATRAGEAATRAGEVAAREAEAAHLKQEIARLSELAAEARAAGEAEAARLQQEIAHLSELSAESRAAREAEVTRLRQDIDGLRGALETARADLEMSEANLRELHSAAETEAGNLRQELAHRDRLLDARRHLEVSLEETKARLVKIEKSRAWKIASRLRKLTPKALVRRVRGKKKKKKTPPAAKDASRPAWFDVNYYLNQEPRLDLNGVDAFMHFATIGWREGRNPHPLFDVAWYVSQNPGLEAGTVDPLQHFLAQIDPFDGESSVAWNDGSRYVSGGKVANPRLPAPYSPPGRRRFVEFDEPAFLARLKNADVLSLDIFDTALVRRVSPPSAVFDLMEAAAQRLDLRLQSLASQRSRAERLARQISTDAGGTPEIGFKDVYDVLARELGLKESERAQLEDLELDIERQVLRANPQVLGWYRQAQSQGKKVIFVSDMYLPRTFLEEVLTAAGFENPVVYVSNEYGSGKWQVRLFQTIAADLDIDASKFLHIGDNPQADKQCAEAAGWVALHYVEGERRQPFALQLAVEVTSDASNLALSVGLGLSREHRVRMEAADFDAEERIARHIGYEVIGPTVLAFAGWMATRAKADRLDRVLFLARDGYLPHQVYEQLRRNGYPACESRYVLASRRLLYSRMFTSVQSVRNAVAKIDFAPETTLAEYLDIFLLPEDQIAACARRLSIADANAPILEQMKGRADYGRAKAELAAVIEDVASAIVRNADEQKKLLEEYYRDAGALEGVSRAGLVDLGWSGSIVRPIGDALSATVSNLTIASYFFGLIGNAKNHLPGDMLIGAYFFRDRDRNWRVPDPLYLPASKNYCDVIGASPALVEVLLSENATTAIGVKRDEASGRIIPVRANDSYSSQQRRLLDILHQEALSFAQDALSILPPEPDQWNLKPLLSQVWTRVLSSPSEPEARWLAAFPHRADASGHASTMALVTMSNSRKLLSAFQSSQWSAGWFALLSPADRARLLDEAEAARRAASVH
ncbi:putative HAD superfamily hydrolase/putative nucleic acid-binding Zn-ribbon protein [Inquilinus ginsengisoli]|uniref:class I SAM-dependent methyltransferase n=1 Tax=Inquilinus ginsengisoli TaxID=363840 RepID=UPI003D1DA342